MVKFEEGQTYICTMSDKPWFTEGEEYPVTMTQSGNLVIHDNDESVWLDKYLNNTGFKFKLKFKLKEESQTSDLIDNQPHYKNQGIEPIDLMRKNFSKEEFAGFLQGNVLKYMLRYKDKNGLEDLKKAKTYLTWLIEEEQNAQV